MIKLIATDFDGTLVPNSGNYEDISDEVYQILTRLQAQGTACMIATGRHPGYIAKRIHRVTFPTVVGFSGHLNYIDGQVDAFVFTRRQLREISAWAEENTTYGLTFRTKENTAIYKDPAHRKKELSMTEETRRKKDLGSISALLADEYMAQAETNEVVRIMLRTEDMTDYPGLKVRFAKDFPGFQLMRTGRTAIDVMNCNRTKASEIEKIMRMRGLSEHEVATIGDGENDLEMLERFEHSFYVGKDDLQLERAARHRKSCIEEVLATILQMNEG